MLDAGISLPDCLVYLEKGETDPEFSQVLGGCLTTILSGHPLSAGMRNYPKVFSPMMVEIVASSEHSGSIASSLGGLAELTERQQERRRRIVSALAYPCCLFAVMMIVVLIFVVFVAPGDDGLFSQLGDEVPWPSQVLIGLSKFVTSPLWLGGSVGLVALFVLLFRRAYRNSADFRFLVDDCCLNFPVLGRLLVRLEAARVFDVLGGASKIGISLVSALHQATRVCSNTSFRKDLMEALESVASGSGVGTALARHTRIPRYATSLIEVSEESGQLAHAMESASAALDDEANSALAQLVSLAEPMLLCLGGLAAGFVAVATFLPIIRLISNF